MDFSHAVLGRSNETLLCLDSTGRTYALAPHMLPSARSLGEPVSKDLKPPEGVTFSGLLAGGEATELSTVDRCWIWVRSSNGRSRDP